MPVLGVEAVWMGALVIVGPITRLTAERAKAVSETLRAMGVELTRTVGGDKRRLPSY